MAIKLSKLSAEASRDFLLEVDIMTKLQPKRMVPLMGICAEDNHLISVYSYFSKGSLEENLHGITIKKLMQLYLRILDLCIQYFYHYKIN